MGNFERLSVLVIVVIIVLIVVIALVQLTESNETPSTDGTQTSLVATNDTTGGTGGGTGAGAGMGSGTRNGVTIPTPVKETVPPSPGPKPISLDDIIRGQQNGTPPAPPPAPIDTPKPDPVAVKEEPKIHVVQPGETIAKIAKNYFPTAVTKGTDAILKANPGVDPSRMRVGTKLTIPVLEGTPMVASGTPSTTTGTTATLAVKPPTSTTSTSITPGGTYTTKKGDTLASISRRAYKTSDRWQDIWLANYDALGDDVDKPAAGIRLKIPR